MTLLILSFVAGLLTVLAPCILPLLPVIVGGSLGAESAHINKRRAIVVTVSLGVSIILFTFLLKVSTVFVMVPQMFWQWLSGGIILFFGVVTLFPTLWEKLPFVGGLNRESNKILGVGYEKKSFWGDVIIGSALGPVFSSCSPTYFLVLATVLPRSFVEGFVYLLAYSVGLSLALFCIAILGQKLADRLGVLADPSGWFKKTLGIIFVIVGIAVGTGFDKKVENRILDSNFNITRFEEVLLNSNSETGSKLPSVATSTTSSTVAAAPTKPVVVDGRTYLTIAQKSTRFPLAPDISTPDGFVNTDGKPITLADLRGKVVLLDIWTYSCINCQRTIPYLNSWYAKYKDKGLVIVGLHTPEFSFEKVQSNVEAAVKDFGIKYPVVLDNDFSTWQAYQNQYWPREYLIDIDGFIVHDHAGEGEYDVTEKAIQDALAERAHRLGLSTNLGDTSGTPKDAISVDPYNIGSPETYFGSARNQYLSNGTGGVSGIQNFTEPQTILPNRLYLIGAWNIKPEYAETDATVGTPQVGSARIDYHYQATHVYFVAGSAGSAVEVEVLRDSAPLTKSVAGKDIYFRDGKSFVKIQENRLYNIIDEASAGDHLLEFIISKPELQAFTFTFG